MTGKRKRHSGEFKAKVALEAHGERAKYEKYGVKSPILHVMQD